jgi:hypothetical protein
VLRFQKMVPKSLSWKGTERSRPARSNHTCHFDQEYSLRFLAARSKWDLAMPRSIRV